MKKIHSTAPVILILLVAAMLSCIERKPERLTKRESPVSAELKSLVAERERLLQTDSLSPGQAAAVGQRHRHTVYRFMAKALIREPEDLYRAALLLGPDDESTAAEVCLQAHYLAAEAASKGHMPARYVAATSLDRYLVLSGRLQLYGTQYLKDDAGKYRLYPYDTATTDSTRAEWGVAPLDSLIARVGALTESATD